MHTGTALCSLQTTCNTLQVKCSPLPLFSPKLSKGGVVLQDEVLRN